MSFESKEMPLNLKESDISFYRVLYCAKDEGELNEISLGGQEDD